MSLPRPPPPNFWAQFPPRLASSGRRNEEGAGQRNFKPPEGGELKRGGEGGESESEGSPEPL